jgi:hypothetical protein
MNKNMIVVLVLAAAAGCATRPQDGAPPAVGSNVVEQDCTQPVDRYLHLMCGDPEAQRLARLAEEERQARLRKEAAERAERERLERERAERLAREEAERKAREAEEARLAAERKAREAEEARLAAERRRLEEEAARKAQEERERAEAERLARERAEREAREAAERECRRLAQERSEGRAMLESFVAKYGHVDEFRGIAGQITEFLNATREPKPCPPA